MLMTKRLWVGAFVLLGWAVAQAAPPAVHPTTGEPLEITCYKGAPAALDGDLSDWNLDAMTPAVVDAPAQVYTGQASWTGPEDCSGTFYLQWDDTYIYIGAIVKDDVISMNKTDGNIWNTDCIEVFFGTTNTAPTGTHTEHYQYGFNANNQVWNWCNMDSGGQSLPNYMTAASSRTPDGYICEVAIAYANIRALSFTEGNVISFHPCIDDTESADREVQITWTGLEAHDQSTGFGHLILSPDPAVAKELSRGPSPAHKATDVPVDTALSWSPGEYAVSHDVYLGTVFADVNTAARTAAKDVLASQAQTAMTYAPAAPLDFGTTYHWRVDEVSPPADNQIFKGQVWSFTTEPYGYPVTPVKATASSGQLNMGPDKTIDGSGLNQSDLHGTEPTTMWLSAGGSPNWIQYEFDQVYKLDQVTVWNSNQMVEAFLGFGAKQVTIETSTDGTTWMPVADVPEFSRAPGAPDYAANTTVNLGPADAKFVKLTINSNWGGVAPQAGLAEVRFSAVPVQAFKPEPAEAATGVSVDADLSWRPGREADSHEVYFGTDQAAVDAGTAAAETVTEHGFDPGALNFGTTYYWKVNEIGADSAYAGNLWSFLTQEFATIDDFESYTDQAGEEIFSTWIDGFTNGLSGSTVGYFTATNATFGETTIIHGGKQSMPLAYDNTKAPFLSEAERTFASPQDWTSNGADSLVVYFNGLAPTSASQPEGNSAAGLYLAVTDTSGKTKVVQHPDPAATNATSWQKWTIPLSEFTAAGVKMTAVKSLTIGVGNKAAPNAGGTGTAYIDDVGYGRSAK